MCQSQLMGACRHLFDKACLERWMATTNLRRYTCPDCRQPLFEAVSPVAPIVPMTTIAPAVPTAPVPQAASNWSFNRIVGKLPVIRMPAINWDAVGLVIQDALSVLFVFMCMCTPVITYIASRDPTFLPEDSNIELAFCWWLTFLFAAIIKFVSA